MQEALAVEIPLIPYQILPVMHTRYESVLTSMHQYQLVTRPARSQLSMRALGVICCCLAFGAARSLTRAAGESYRVKRGTIPLIMTPNGPHNLLPAFSFQLHGGEAVQHVEADKTAPDLDPDEAGAPWCGMSLDMPDDMFEHQLKPHGVLPYRLIDGYRGVPRNGGRPVNVVDIHQFNPSTQRVITSNCHVYYGTKKGVRGTPKPHSSSGR